MPSRVEKILLMHFAGVSQMASAWIEQIFEKGRAPMNRGEPLRRSVSWVKKRGSVEDLITEVRRRKFHMIENGGQYIIFCNSGVMQIHC